MSGMNVNSVGIRKTIKIDTSILPVKYEATTIDENPVEVMRFSLDPISARFVTIQARVGNDASGGERGSFLFTQRIRVTSSANARLDERVDNHTFRTSNLIDIYFDVSGSEHILFVKGINASILFWHITVGQV